MWMSLLDRTLMAQISFSLNGAFWPGRYRAGISINRNSVLGTDLIVVEIGEWLFPVIQRSTFGRLILSGWFVTPDISHYPVGRRLNPLAKPTRKCCSQIRHKRRDGARHVG